MAKGYSRYISRSLSDCTDVWDYTFSREYTVREFIDEILSANKEHGSIRINDFFSGPKCEFAGEFMDDPDDEFKALLDEKVEKVSSNGGYGSMDYVIVTKKEPEEKEVETMTKTEKLDTLEALVDVYEKLLKNQEALIDNQIKQIDKYKELVDLLQEENTKLKAHAILKEAGML